MKCPECDGSGAVDDAYSAAEETQAVLDLLNDDRNLRWQAKKVSTTVAYVEKKPDGSKHMVTKRLPDGAVAACLGDGCDFEVDLYGDAEVESRRLLEHLVECDAPFKDDNEAVEPDGKAAGCNPVIAGSTPAAASSERAE